MTTTFETLRTNIERWSAERGILEHSTSTAQLLKAMSEMGELADAHAKRDLAGEIDAVGDTLVCLVNFCALHQIDIVACLEAAWNEIKDRQGHMIAGGVFVKDEL